MNLKIYLKENILFSIVCLLFLCSCAEIMLYSSPDDPNSYLLKGIKQIYQEKNQCGPTSLAIIFRYYKNQTPLSEIDRATRNKRSYTNPDVMVDYAIRQGFVAERKIIEDVNLLKAYIKNDVPVIVLTRFNPKKLRSGHYVVLIGYTSKGFIIQDPEKGRISRYYESFKRDSRFMAAGQILTIPIFSEERYQNATDEYGNLIQ